MFCAMRHSQSARQMDRRQRLIRDEAGVIATFAAETLQSRLELMLRDLSATTTAYASPARLAGFTAGWNPGSVLGR
jgi:hypothetical protein